MDGKKAERKVIEQQREQELKDLHEERVVYKQLQDNIKILLKKKKALFKSKQELVAFKEPVLFLIRRCMDVEFFEDIKEGKYEFEHSDKEIGKLVVTLSPAKLLRFPYGDTFFRGYILYEDEYLPYPQTPLIDAETVKINLDKILNDVRKWKAQEAVAIGKMWQSIAFGIAIIGVVYVLYRVVVPQAPPVPQVAQQIAQNVSNATNILLKNATILK